MIFDLITKPQATAWQTSLTFSLTFSASPFNSLLRSLELILHEMVPKVLGQYLANCTNCDSAQHAYGLNQDICFPSFPEVWSYFTSGLQD